MIYTKKLFKNIIMSKKSDKKKSNPTKKKVVISQKKKVTPTTSRSRGFSGSTREPSNTAFVFGKKNYIFMAAGVGIIFLGMLLMSGGGMDDPNVWEPEVIYGWRRTLLAPLVILVGLGLEIYAIFVDKDSNSVVKANEAA